ncbi:alpha/beta hydrolase family esterase [Kiloniella majae]|uniref:alpha/beta hydrolase family esterase n=1 Tax=Kiloniella majae TaxID=1938558 RepID=UPI0013022BA1|nr:dienelactone hydrolase family protein [Kiloniella majae]
MIKQIIPALFLFPVFTSGASHVALSETENNLCGQIGDPCQVKLGSYNISLPNVAGSGSGSASGTKTHTSIPAIIFYHGAGRSGADTLKNTAMIKTMNDRGYAVIAPSGLKRPNSRFGPGWSFIPQRKKMRDELAFTYEVLDDASVRFNIDRDRVLISGFSIGGSLVWYLACQDNRVAAAYAPIAGAFWSPEPTAKECSGPIKLMQTHGWRDKTVPLEGRPLGGGTIQQGDVFHSLKVIREVNQCEGLRADEFDTSSTTPGSALFWQRWWTRCNPASNLRLALHTGGHSIPKGWAKMALDWFEKVTTPTSKTN